MNKSDYLQLAIDCALNAGELLLKGFGTLFSVEYKPGKYNLVTEYDKKAEQQILNQISAKYPSHTFLAEESGASLSHHSVIWIIDPLDGTVNFARGIPVFSVSIGVCVEGEITCGVVYQPITQELFFAEKGQGAFLQKGKEGTLKKLAVTQESDLNNTFLATGFPYNVDENPLHCIETFDALSRKGIPLRRLGSAAIDLSYVAAGRFDGYWEVSLQPWDLAAGKLLVEEAGGKVTRYDGSLIDPLQAGTMVATNGYIHKALIRELQ